MPWTRRDQENFDRLRQKRRAAGGTASEGNRRDRRDRRRDDEGEDGIYVISGRHADNFLSRLFGNDEDDDEGEDEDDADEDPPAPPGNRFFRGRG